MTFSPKKSLGQHFLIDQNIIRKIIDNFTPAQDSFCLEIGPGQGALTKHLLNFCNENILFIDTDKEAVDFLQAQFPTAKNQFVLLDFLQYDFSDFPQKKLSLIGNLPYNISSQIFFKVLEQRQRIATCTFMIQKEVAERIAVKEGCKTYGILSVLLQAYYDIEYLFDVSPNVFHPRPNVQSAVIRLTRNKTATLACDETLFFRVVKQSFGQRRKMLRKSLKQLLPQNTQILEEFLTKRPEMLSVEDFVNLTMKLTK